MSDAQAKPVYNPLVSKLGSLKPDELFIPRHLELPQTGHANISRIKDDVIDLRCAIARTNIPPSLCFIKKETFYSSEEYRFSVELTHLSISFDHFTTEKWRLNNLHVGNLAGTGRRLRTIFDSLRSSHTRLQDVDQAWLDDWLVRISHLDATTRIPYINLWRRMSLYGPMLSFESLNFDPWGERSALKVAGGQRKSENKTPRIPEQIYGPMMRWALFYVDHAVDDILSSRRSLENQLSSRAPVWVSDERLRRHLAQMLEQGKRIPVNDDGEPAWFLIAREAGLSIPIVKARREHIEKAIDQMGSCSISETEAWAFLPGTQIPWRGRLAGVLGRASQLEIQNCVAACYFIIGIFSGMRDSEVTHLQDTALKTKENGEGRPIRYVVSGRIFKGRDTRAGVEHDWIVIEPVARAIAALLKIKKHLASTRNEPFGRQHESLIFYAPTETVAMATPTFRVGTANRYLNSFFEHCHNLAEAACCEAAEGDASIVRSLYSIPKDERGFAWRLTSRQLRRTVAWFIANQPFGIAAGRIQFGHAAEMMFEGYAGTSPSGFRDEIEQERELARLKDIVELYENHMDGFRSGGPFARRLHGEFERIQKDLGDLPGVIIDLPRREKMLKNLAVTLHPGFLNDCFYYADHALCKARDGEAKGPNWTRCKPEKCPNSCISKKHEAAISACLADAEEMKKRKGLSPIQQKAIQNQIDTYGRLLKETAKSSG